MAAINPTVDQVCGKAEIRERCNERADQTASRESIVGMSTTTDKIEIAKTIRGRMLDEDQ